MGSLHPGGVLAAVMLQRVWHARVGRQAAQDETTKMQQSVGRLVLLVSGESAAQAHADKYQFVIRFLEKLTRVCKELALGQDVSAPELEGFAEGLWQMQAGQRYANETLGPLTTSRKWRQLIDSLKSVVLTPILSQLHGAPGEGGVLKLHFGIFPNGYVGPPIADARVREGCLPQ